MVEVDVQDKHGPQIVCPANQTVNCDFEYWELDEFVCEAMTGEY